MTARFSKQTKIKFNSASLIALLITLFSASVSSRVLANSYTPEQLELRSAQTKSFLEILPTDDNPRLVRYFGLMRLQKAISEFVSAVHVPYVWGGNKIGEPETCLECSQCIAQNRVKPKSRTSRCTACNRCGVDCSHLVHQVFNAAGFVLPYASSGILAKAHPASLLREFQLVDIGKDFTQAQPGDIIVYRRHVGILMANHGNGRGDLVHASRFAREGREKIGGIRYDINRNIVKPRGGLIRILRHRDLYSPSTVPLSYSMRKLESYTYTSLQTSTPAS